MKRIKMTADILLGIIQGVFSAADFVLEGESEKTATSALNIEFYSFKRRIKSADDYLASMEKSLNQAYCLCELLQAKRLYSKDIDHLTIDGRLTVWLQTDKIKLLEAFIEECNSMCCGEVSEVSIVDEKRSMLVELGAPQMIAAQSASEIGESATLTIAVKMELAPSLSSYNDYKIELSFDGGETYATVPFTSWTYVYNTSQVAIPVANKSDSGFINVSQSNSISLNLYEFNKPLTKELRKIALRCNAIDKTTELNAPIYLRMTIGAGDATEDVAEVYIYKVLPKTITINGANTTFNTMAVVFAPEGGL